MTRTLLSFTFGDDVAGVILGYVLAVERYSRDIAYAGEWETCEHGLDDWDMGLVGACLGGHYDLAMLMISHGADDWDGALQGACESGHIDLIRLMISRGADDWNGGLRGACYSGQLAAAELMIACGANNWDGGLCIASCQGHHELVELMVIHARNWLLVKNVIVCAECVEKQS